MMMSSSSSCSILCFVLLALSLHLYSAAASDCIALLQFADSFTITKDASRESCEFVDNPFELESPRDLSYPKTRSWNNGTDCCSWDGVTCDNGRKAVIELDLTCSWLQGPFLSNSTLFSLRNLKRLNLYGNDFELSEIPSRFHVFPDMTHLNLSHSFLTGLIPREIAHLSKLESLDLSHGSFYNPHVIEDNVLKSIMHNLTRLRRLALDYNDMSQVYSSFTNLSSSSLNYLSLSFCGRLQGFMVSDLFRLPKLQYLYLSWNYGLSDTVLSSNWTSPLLALDLSYTLSYPVGRLLEKITTLKTLHYLDLHYNPQLTGEIPASIGNLTALEYLDLSVTGIGSLPSTLVNLQQLSYLNLQYNYNMSGVFDFEVFANMRRMTTLLFPYKQLNVVVQDDGNVSFPELTGLSLSGCNLTKFPYFLSSSKGLQYLYLSENMITAIPRWLWSLRNDTLKRLDLSDNLISGIIPSSVCQLSQLRVLSLSYNQLSGTIPGCISNLTLLEALVVNSNHLDGPLPRSLSNCTDMFSLDVGYNQINDTFPDWLQPVNLAYLILQSNEFHGPIQIGDTIPFSGITSYNLADNAFTGHWPADYFVNSSAYIFMLDLSKNNFVGPIPLPPPGVQYYVVSDNNFTGEIPAAICDATGLKVINLSNNSLVGSIPRCFAKTSATLSVLNLRNNKLIGEIPQIFSPNNCLRTVDLSRNTLSGTVPRSLSNCKDLEVLDLSYNAIEDVFPSWLAALPKLHVLVIRSNRFYGPVQYDSRECAVHPFRQLHIFDISVNRFSGPLPTKYLANFEAMMDYSELGTLQFVSDYSRYTYQDSVMVVMKGNEFELVKILKVFTTIDLSANFFEGEFPEVVGNLKALKGLNFSHNHITGNISPSVRNLSNLEWLDLSSNNLSGEIPPGMADLTFLGTLNLSRNQLSGPIPTGPQFNTFGSDAFEGNPQLCGFPLPKECGSKDDQDPPPPPNNVEEDEGEDLWMEWKAVPVGYIFGIVFGFIIGYIFR